MEMTLGRNTVSTILLDSGMEYLGIPFPGILCPRDNTSLGYLFQGYDVCWDNLSRDMTALGISCPGILCPGISWRGSLVLESI